MWEMAKSPKSSRAKAQPRASKPELKPLDPYLAELLNPALNREREAAEGFGERAQAAFEAGPATTVDPALAKKLGLRGPDDGPDRGEDVGDDASLAADGVSATVQALTKLLTEGNPLFKDGKAWTPHRPPRPEKSEGGIPSRSSPSSSRPATSRRRSANSWTASGGRSATRFCSASRARARPSRWRR